MTVDPGEGAGALLPPSLRSRAALGLTAAAAAGRFELQVCRRCGAVQYPPREACHRCLSSTLDWQLQDGAGELLAETLLMHSHEAFFRAHLPIRLGLVRLDCGPSAVVYLHDGVPPAPARVMVDARLDKSGCAVLVARDPTRGGKVEMSSILQALSNDPKGRSVLVTDAGSAVGVALVRALVDAGAGTVWAGCVPDVPRKGGLDDLLGAFKQVRLLPLDVTRDESVAELARVVGEEVDVVINNAEAALADARAEIDVHYFGLLRLAGALAPSMRARATTPNSTVTAWVNLLSIYALSSAPAQSTFSASKAAAYSLSQWLRAQLQPAGIRVINVFPGPVDEERYREVPGPKIAPLALARAMVKSLQDGVEDVYPGEVAQDWYTRWRESPKVLERMLAADR